MLDKDGKNQEKNPKKTLALTPEERHNLVGAFAWLIRQDKKQNSALYQSSLKQLSNNNQTL